MFNVKWLQYRPGTLKNLIWSRFSKWKITCRLSVWCWVSYVKVALRLSIDSQIRKYVNLWIFCQLGGEQMWSILSSQKNIPRSDFSGQMSVRPFARTIWICSFCVCMYAWSSACIGIFELDGAPSRPLCFGEHCTVLTKPCDVPGAVSLPLITFSQSFSSLAAAHRLLQSMNFSERRDRSSYMLHSHLLLWFLLFFSSFFHRFKFNWK